MGIVVVSGSCILALLQQSTYACPAKLKVKHVLNCLAGSEPWGKETKVTLVVIFLL